MKFATFPLGEAEGIILAHSLRQRELSFAKGHALREDDIALLQAAGITEVTGARLDPGDLIENEAAGRIAKVLAGPDVRITAARTGRCNLEAGADGVVEVDSAAINAFNAVDEAVTVATLVDKQAVRKGQIIATVKIIPYAVPATILATVEAAATPLRIAAFRPRHYALVSTLLPEVKPSVITVTENLTARRLVGCGGDLTASVRCVHELEAIKANLRSVLAAGADVVLIAGATATSDRGDLIPQAIVGVGGEIDHFGMPVDPGNLLVLAQVGGVPILVLPGCARSPKINGFDWVLHRLAAGLSITRKEIMAMGVGGLLVDTPSRPLPRDRAVKESLGVRPRVAAVVLAAGQSRRMEGENKLTRLVDGVPLIRRTVEAVVTSRARPVVVVTGHEASAIKNLLAGMDVTIAFNPAYAEGLSTSLRAGLDALPAEIDAALICLADMPAVGPGHLNALIDGFDLTRGRVIGVPTHVGKRGNPSLWGRVLFDDMRAVSGDVGARHLIGANEPLVYEVEFEDTAVVTDLDTPAQWADYGASTGS